MTGVDPTGWGGVVAGFGDQRGVELLVQAGFTPEEAVRIATLNGAMFLGEDSRIGTLATGKQADIVIVRGNPAANIRVQGWCRLRSGEVDRVGARDGRREVSFTSSPSHNFARPEYQ